MRMFVLVLAAFWFQPLLHARTTDGQPLSILSKAVRLLNLGEYLMAAGLIALACIAAESGLANSVNHTFIALATTITTGVAQ